MESLMPFKIKMIAAEAQIAKLTIKEQQDQEKTEEFPPELLIKHPLQNRWTLWYYEPDRSRNWEDSQREVTSFDTAEDFWGIYNHVKPASELKTGCDYSLFKEGVRPMWEDTANKNGGRWLIEIAKKHRQADLDRIWLEVILCMIGEGFNENSDEICGAVVNIRRMTDKVAIWTADANGGKVVMDIGRKLKDRLMITTKNQLQYQSHRDSMVKSGSSTKNTYTL